MRTLARSLWGGGLLLVLLLQAACATGRPRAALGPDVDFLEPGAVSTRPVPVERAGFQRALLRLSEDVRLARKTPREAARELLGVMAAPSGAPMTLGAAGDWTLEMTSRGRGLGLFPERQAGPVRLTPVAEAALEAKYLRWCEPQGGGDCLGLLDEGAFLRAEDRRTLALALALGLVLDETRAALGRELNARALVALVVWTAALYCTMWMVPEPTTKALAATLTVILMGWLGLETVYGLMDGWARLASAAEDATTFEELRAAGARFGEVLGEDAARVLVLAVATLTGRTLGEMAARVKSLPGYGLAGAQWEAQGGAIVLGRGESLAQAVATVEAVATSPQGPLAVVMFKKGPGRVEQAPGGRSCETVMSHRGGNRQVELSDGQRWHLPRGKSAADLPARDTVGDQLQEAVHRAAKEWGPKRLSRQEQSAITNAQKKGKYWLARLLDREAQGRYVHEKVKQQFQQSYRFNHQGVDVTDLSPGGYQYEILSGTDSNLARHGRRMAGEFFRMLTF